MLRPISSGAHLASQRPVERSRFLHRSRIIVSLSCLLLLGPSASSICTAYNYIATPFEIGGTHINGNSTVSGFGLALRTTAVWPDSGTTSKGVSFAFTGPEYPTDMYWAWNFSGGYYTATINPGVGCTSFPAGGSCRTETITQGSFHSSGGITAITVTGQLFNFGPASANIMVAPSGSVGGGVCSGGGGLGSSDGGAGSSGLQSSNRRCDDEEEPPDPCVATDSCRDEEQIAGAMLFDPRKLPVPVTQEHGFTDYVFGHAEQQPANPSPMIGNPTYVFGSSDIPFSRFGIPDSMPNGDHEFQIMFDGMSFPLQANQEFSFTNYVPGGVQRFYVTGFDPSEMLDRTAAPTFTHAFQFAAEGATFVAVGAIVPGNYDLAGNVDAADYEIWKSTFGSTTDLRADGNQNGIIDAGDYTVWRDHLGGDFTPATGTGSTGSVPEPSALILVALAFADMVAIRWR